MKIWIGDIVFNNQIKSLWSYEYEQQHYWLHKNILDEEWTFLTFHRYDKLNNKKVTYIHDDW